MPTPSVIPANGDRFVLLGRIVPMGGREVISTGAIYVQGNRIVDVLAANRPAPTGFDKVPRIDTGGTVYPGLIELHNHLSYNAMPLWDVPKKYTNNSQWKNHADYQCKITKPAQVLGRTNNVSQALIRFVECRALLGGTTTSQGVTLAGVGSVLKYYRGLVRNAEQSGDASMRSAGTHIADLAEGKASDYLKTLKKNQASCYLQHLCEGRDERTRKLFDRLKLSDGTWAISDAFCGIHSTALNAEQLAILHDHGGSIIWSPLSNYLLYGETLEVEHVAQGTPMGLGSDWAPSGSKNLLGELKVAYLASKQKGNIHSPEALVKMVTESPARILKWHEQVGSLAPGRRADLLCVRGTSQDPYLQLILARETDLSLVAIDGVPRVGLPELMANFAGDAEPFTVGGEPRQLNLADKEAEAVVGKLPLGKAIEILTAAMQHLPELGEKLDANGGSGFFSGDAGDGSESLRVFFDLDETTDLELQQGAVSFASVVQPMSLDPITVMDDDLFLARLYVERNLPDFVKQGLPGLYGKPIPKPDGGAFLERAKDQVMPEVWDTSEDLSTVLKLSGELSREQLLQIVGQALVLITENYVHLPQKRATHAIDPAQRLRLLKYRVEQSEPGEGPTELEVHRELAATFMSLCDLHTAYRLPRPFGNRVAWLPFMVEEYWERGHCHFLVSKVVGTPGSATFVPGVELLYWKGAPVERVVVENGERHGGGNPAARRARGLSALTLRPLSHGVLPTEDWVDLVYQDKSGKTRELRQHWLVFSPVLGELGVDPFKGSAEAAALGLDSELDDMLDAKRAIYAAPALRRHRQAGQVRLASAVAVRDDVLETTMPSQLRPRIVHHGKDQLGYLRIFTFNVPSAEAFIDEVASLLARMPKQGLLIDVRGNPGGLIPAAEGILQLFSPVRITPLQADLINSTTNLKLCRTHGKEDGLPGLDLSPWVPSMAASVQTGATHSLSFPITPVKLCNSRGRVYHGPTVLITDALCYSATDIFAASFQDHGIGPVLGVHDATGAGGANVWSHAILCRLAEKLPESPYTPLPNGADLRVAVRRILRVGSRAGVLLEDFGVRPDQVHRMTLDDLMHDNRDLIAAAAKLVLDAHRKTGKAGRA